VAVDVVTTARDAYIEAGGVWSPAWEVVARAEPEFFAAYVRLFAAPERGGRLDAKTRALVRIAVDGAATRLAEPELRESIGFALDAGATRDEIVEVFELAATLGIHACNIGVPLMQEALAAAGTPLPDAPLTPGQAELKAEFERVRGYWNPFWDGILRLDAEFFGAYLEFSGLPWRSGPLSPKTKELVYIAFDASATHMFLPGLKLHIENALEHGATPHEIMDVLEIASTLGMTTLRVGLPILDEELANRNAQS
jgi:alkylhydroperoxidase/carboxymuconolactone decarboxylase family protein YurZ